MTTIELRSISPGDLALLGIEDVAYVTAITIDGMLAFAIHSADGQRLGIAPSRESALGVIRENDLEPVSVH